MATIEEFTQELITEHYKKIIQEQRPDYLSMWPLIHGYILVSYTFNDWIILSLKNNTPHFFSTSGGGAIPQAVIGFPEITPTNINRVRENIKKYARIDGNGGVIIFKNVSGTIDMSEN